MDIVVPQLGESVIEARVARWLKKQGEQVAAGDALVELETDKIDLEVNAESAGVLARIDRQEGEDVKVGEVLGAIEAGDSAGPNVSSATPQHAVGPNFSSGTAAPAAAADVRATATAKKIAEEHGVDLSQIKGTGDGGRITKEDVQKAVDAKPAATAAAAPGGVAQGFSRAPVAPVVPAATPAAVAQSFSPAPVAPAVPATTPAAVAQSFSPAPAVAARAPQPVGPNFSSARPVSGDRPEERVRMTKRRATIARRLVEAQHTAAMLTTFNEVDMTAVQALRARRKEGFQKRHGVNLGLSSFFVKAAIGALKAFPRINAEIQGDEMVLKHYYDIGIAVGASSGLVVPVLRDADRMTFWDIEAGIKDFAKRAEDGSLTLEEIKGGTFTITNGGVFGSLMSTPILNPPQVGILGLHKIEERPVAVDGQVVVRPMMYLALSYDHRIVDGAEAVQFLVKVKEFIEDPGHLLIEG